MTAGLTFASCTPVDELAGEIAAPVILVEEDGTTTIDAEALKINYFDQSPTELTDPLADWLKFMIEEEKLARDLYLAFYESFKIPVFKNIPRAEANHMNAVLTLMNEYGVDDPSSSDNGVFTNAGLQQLYDDLLATGKVSLNEALKVGALVEETDIIDLAGVYELDPGEDFKALAEALMLGSRNHLRAFNRILELRGVDYVPVELDQEEFDQIISTGWERGTGFCRRK